MFSSKVPSQHAWLWWSAVISLTIGISIFILLKPGEYDYNVQNYRSMALIIPLVISGLCVIIGTRGRWFGKGL